VFQLGPGHLALLQFSMKKDHEKLKHLQPVTYGCISVGWSLS